MVRLGVMVRLLHYDPNVTRLKHENSLPAFRLKAAYANEE